MQDYIRILAQKTDRLKSMVQDVFEVSKAASGSIALQLEPLDLGKLVRQTMADMEEKVAASAAPQSFKTRKRTAAPFPAGKGAFSVLFA